MTHTLHQYNSMVTTFFIMVVEWSICWSVDFCLVEQHFLHSNSAAMRAMLLNSLLSSSFAHYYLPLK